MMRIGILSLNFSWHGEATAAATWATHLKRQGYDAELFTFSKSGKKLKRMRTDYAFTCISSRDIDTALKFLDSKDIIVSFGTGVPSEKETPHYLTALSRMQTPLVVYVPIQSDMLFKAYRYSEHFLELPTVVGTLFLRESIRKHCYEGEYRDSFKKFPYFVVKHPVDLDQRGVVRKDGNRIICTTRIAPSKKLKQILTAIRDFDLNSIADISIHGDKGESRYGYFLEEEFGGMFLNLYKGPYTHDDLSTIYENARFCFDMTNFVSDGGVQNTYLEAVKRSTVPIVPSRWNVNDSCLTVPEPEPTYIAEAVYSAIDMPESARLALLERGFEYIRQFHDPRDQVRRFTSYCGSLIAKS